MFKWLTKSRFTLAYSALAVIAGIVELRAILRKDRGDTITEHIRTILKTHPIIWWVGVGLSAWAFNHFFFGKK